MENMKKIRKLNQQRAEKEFALSQMVSLNEKSLLQPSKNLKSFHQSINHNEAKTFVIKDLDKNHVHFIDREEKADKLMAELNELPEIDALLQNIWNQYMNSHQKEQQIFLEACYQGEVAIVKRVISSKTKHPIQPSLAVTDQGKNGIHLATVSGTYKNVEIIPLLVSCGVDINGKTHNQNRTPLMLGCILGNDLAVRALLENGARSDLQDYEDNTAFHLACIYNQESIVAILLESEFSVEVRNRKKMTPIDCITNVNIFELVKGKVQIPYSKTPFNKVLFPNSRRDHLEKLFLNLKEKEKQETITTEEEFSSYTSKKMKSRKEHREEKIKQVMIKEVKETNLSSFKKISLLGRGAFGEVFLVENLHDSKKYAMKVLDKGMIMRQNILRYAMTERKILSTINHPFVVRLHYAFQSSEKLYLVMQYCPGGDLLQLVKKRGKLQEGIVRKYVAEIILALDELHKAEIIYRDLKAGNVVLDKNGHACLTDFGLSKEAALSHSFCGSTAYLAPEMIWRRGHTKMLDWYLLGVFVYECLTGRPPFWDTNKQQLLSNIKSGRYKQLPSQFSKQVRDFVQNLLRSNYSKRLGIGGVQNIKNHPWFKGVNWEKVAAGEQEMQAVEEKEGKPIKEESFTEPKFIDNMITGWQFDEKKK